MCGKIKTVQLVWTARSDAVFELFQDTLAELVAATTAPGTLTGMHTNETTVGGFSFEPQLYLTTISKQGSNSRSTRPEFAVPLRSGRPVLAEAIGHGAGSGSTLLVCCGPTPLLEAASNLALDRGYIFHHEVFDW
jgi:hypothetical protein